MQIKISELTRTALDGVVAKCEQSERQPIGNPAHFSPSTNWSQGGPIIERERICLRDTGDDGSCMWEADDQRDSFGKCTGPTPLIAAMRCYVASKLGNTVDIPDDLAP